MIDLHRGGDVGYGRGIIRLVWRFQHDHKRDERIPNEFIVSCYEV